VLHQAFLRRAAYQDNHHYQIYTLEDKALDLEGHLRKAAQAGKLLRRIGWHRRIIVGEWSAALDPQSLKGLSAGQAEEAYRKYVAAQLAAFATTDAWFYWTYRTEDGGPWSFRDLTDRSGWPVPSTV
jgi:glucan 1,3-beta-glucosidase